MKNRKPRAIVRIESFYQKNMQFESED